MKNRTASYFLLYNFSFKHDEFHKYEAHQGVMADRRHSLKRGDRLSKKQRQTTASDWEKSDKLRFMLWAKSDSDIYYNKTSDKAATK